MNSMQQLRDLINEREKICSGEGVPPQQSPGFQLEIGSPLDIQAKKDASQHNQELLRQNTQGLAKIYGELSHLPVASSQAPVLLTVVWAMIGVIGFACGVGILASAF